ncbi:MAG: hypothetical protein WCZ72_00975 [Gemmobacter sp.]
MTKQRRWIRSVIEASKEPVPVLPWARATRPARAAARPAARARIARLPAAAAR